MKYADYLRQRAGATDAGGIPPTFMPPSLFDFQADLVEWAVRRGRAAIFADCGLGKTLMQLVWAMNYVEHTNKPTLVLTPLAVAHQTTEEAAKFDLPAMHSRSGELGAEIVVTNYERLHHFNPSDFGAVVLDESSILKNYDGARRTQITAFMRDIPYRLLATATAAPNDYTELGTSSEALGQMGHIDMLNKFFKNDQNNSATKRMYGEAPKWRFKGHAELPFWRWVTTWARAVRRPSDLGYSDERFTLPPLNVTEHIIEPAEPPPGMLFNVEAGRLDSQRREKRRTIEERTGVVTNLVAGASTSLVWCQLNAEGDALEHSIPNSVQVSGSDNDDSKEEKLLAFARGEVPTLITKPRIGAWGLNFQHCSTITYYPSHSYEQYYQAVRRCWRFGQQSPVDVHLVLGVGERKILKNLTSKAKAADAMFTNLVREMNNPEVVTTRRIAGTKTEVPAWL